MFTRLTIANFQSGDKETGLDGAGLTSMRIPFYLASALLVLSSADAASILYDNGAPAYSWLYNMASPDGLQATSFSLGSTETLTSVVYWVYEMNPDPGGTTTPPPAGVDWSIYSNNSGTPGSVLESGSATVTATTTHGMDGDFSYPIGDGFQADFSLGTFTLGPGTYWLGLEEPNSAGGAGWIVTSTSNQSVCCVFSNGVWTNRPAQDPTAQTFGGTDLAFQVLGDAPAAAPEPSSGYLLIPAIAGVVILRRRRKAAERIVTDFRR